MKTKKWFLLFLPRKQKSLISLLVKSSCNDFPKRPWPQGTIKLYPFLNTAAKHFQKFLIDIIWSIKIKFKVAAYLYLGQEEKIIFLLVFKKFIKFSHTGVFFVSMVLIVIPSSGMRQSNRPP